MIPRLTLERYDREARGEVVTEYLQEAIEDGAVFAQSSDGVWRVTNIPDPVQWSKSSVDKNEAARGYVAARDNLSDRILYWDRLIGRPRPSKRSGPRPWWRRLLAV
jgi:hypothetical protein